MQVNGAWPVLLRWEAFCAIIFIARSQVLWEAMCNTGIVEGSVEMAVAMLRTKPNDAAPTLALDFLASIFGHAPAYLQQQLGQAFIKAEGPAQLVCYVKAGATYRNIALLTILTFAMMDARNAPAVHGGNPDISYLYEIHMADVMTELEKHAAMDVRTLCKVCPPNTANEEVTAQLLRNLFQDAFNQLPPWPMQ